MLRQKRDRLIHTKKYIIAGTNKNETKITQNKNKTRKIIRLVCSLTHHLPFQYSAHMLLLSLQAQTGRGQRSVYDFDDKNSGGKKRIGKRKKGRRGAEVRYLAQGLS